MLVGLAGGVGQAKAAQFTTIYSFSGNIDGSEPVGHLVLRNGLLYGATYLGGKHGGGTLFKFDPASGMLTVLHSFSNIGGTGDVGTGLDGCNPEGGVAFAPNGKLYGTASDCGSIGYGTLYQVDVTPKTLTVIHNFADDNDGLFPGPALTLGRAQSFYGVATGGPYPGASVFLINPGTGVFRSLHVFPNYYTTPSASLTAGAGGLFYGSTTGSGSAVNCSDGCGTLFTINQTTKAFTTIYKFNDLTDGAYPNVALTPDGKGNLFGGTTESMRGKSLGTIFKITDGASPPRLTTVYQFPGGDVGLWLVGELVLEPTTGVFYGVGFQTNTENNGTIFKFNPQDNSATSLHTFPIDSDGLGGRGPSGALTPNGSGSYYGMTSRGGAADDGTIYLITP